MHHLILLCAEALEIITKGALVVSIRERYEFSGVVALCARRDKRSGLHRGKVRSELETFSSTPAVPNTDSFN